MAQGEPITFLVPGHDDVATAATRGAVRSAADSPYGELKHAALLSAVRATGARVPVTAIPGEDIVVLHIDGGPELVLHPENARDLLAAQTTPSRSGTAAQPGAPVDVPVHLQWQGLEEGLPSRGTSRGVLGQVVLRAIEIFKGKAVDTAADFAASKVVARFDAQVTPGVYRLSPDRLPILKSVPESRVTAVEASDGPVLVLVHGTFSTTNGTFSKLWSEHPQRVRDLFDHYGNRVYALDHQTLGESPIANARLLVDALPAGARVHLVTHSRGGLVAEVLARACADTTAGFTAFDDRAYAAQLSALKALVNAAQAKRVTVERVVRVACPARGTLLASKRLDAYLSVFKWTLQLAEIPVVPELVDFVAEVARRRADPELIPGLAAQIPNSPLVQWLHSGELRLPGDLRVIAGDMDGDSITTWLKTLVADSFYWTDNDLVVQTRSMYGGTPRASSATFKRDEGGAVSHFNYFRNASTANAIVDALIVDQPSGFQTIGPMSWAGESATGTRASLVRAAKADPSRPALFLLPGILGSNLGIDGDRIWLGWRVVNGFARLAYTVGQADRVEPDGPIGTVYDALGDHLSKTHDVIPFAFDWRVPIEQEAERLAEAIDAALDARVTTGQPVRIVAHSMGGLVARTVAIVKPNVWTRMMQHESARLLMLGTPNGGSWAPMQVLSGDDTFGNLLVTVGAPFRTDETRALIAGFPGLIQLQAGLLDTDLRLATTAAWQRLADEDLERLRKRTRWHHLPLQLDVHRWGVPTQPILDLAVDLRRKLDEQLERASELFANRVLLVAGEAEFTPGGYQLEDGGLVYVAAPAGDGRVPLTSAMLPGVRAWSVPCEHGSLPKYRDAFAAYEELLQTGTTARLPVVSPSAVRSADAVPAAPIRSRPSRMVEEDRPPELPDDVLRAVEAEPVQRWVAPSRAPLNVEVLHGDLMFVAEPLLIGHYEATKLTGTEKVMDRLIGEQMSESLRRGLYPSAPGEHQIFINIRERSDDAFKFPRPEAVIVVGLGEEGSLRSTDLVHSVRQAVIAWSQRLAERVAPPPRFVLAATLIASGGIRITVGEAAQMIAQGVREANARLDPGGDTPPWPVVDTLRLIELYQDRANEAWRALRVLSGSAPGAYKVGELVRESQAGLPRALDVGYRGADYDFISAVGETQVPAGADPKTVPEGDLNSRIVYTLDTRRARTEVRAQSTQVALIRKLVKNASNVTSDERIGGTLFKLLVPIEIEPYLAGSTETLLELNDESAGIPWELLSADRPDGGGVKPWAIRTKLIRKLRTPEFRSAPRDANAEAAVLVVGEPQCNPKIYPRLDGARREAEEVVKTFQRHADPSTRVAALISPDDRTRTGADAEEILNTVFGSNWRIVHIAGHGQPPTKTNPRGVVLSDDLFLGPREINDMRVVPELVFVNCCYLAARDPQLVLASPELCQPYDRATFAATVAEQLIRIGVRCVVAAGWAVDDRAAHAFATTFYESLLSGRRFMDAVADAREAALPLHKNTWAAYQCYGDPDWVFRRSTADAQRPSPPSITLAGIASADSLRLALETLAVRGEYGSQSETARIALADQLKYMQERFGDIWGRSGAVAAEFGRAWASLGRLSEASAWYERAIAAEDGGAGLRAVEQLANLQARIASASVSERSSPEELQAADEAIGVSLTTLDKMLALGATAERNSLRGAAWKRRALVRALRGDAIAEREALTEMRDAYADAAEIARAEKRQDWFYPAMNRLATELALAGGDIKALKRVKADLDDVRASIRAKATADPDFWSVVGETELGMYEALLTGGLAGAVEDLKVSFTNHYARVSAPRFWKSVYDNARFVLSAYERHASAGEKRAAAALLGTLREFADPARTAEARGVRRTPPPSRRTKARKKR